MKKITPEMKDQALTILNEMLELVEYPESDDLDIIRMDLEDSMKKLLALLTKKKKKNQKKK